MNPAKDKITFVAYDAFRGYIYNIWIYRGIYVNRCFCRDAQCACHSPQKKKEQEMKKPEICLLKQIKQGNLKNEVPEIVPEVSI